MSNTITIPGNLGGSSTCFNIQQETSLLQFCVPDSYVSNTDASFNSTDLDFVWILICGFMVMLMQLGFTLVEVGSVRAKSTINIMFKNICDFCAGCIVWFVFGWALTAAPSDDANYSNEFIGSGDMTLKDTDDYLNWFFSMVFAATAATIVSGAVAERTTIVAYLAYSILLTAWVYPVVVYWVWSGSGWLSAGKDFQMIDFAGSGVVHMVGGFSGLVGAIFVGPRKGTPAAHSVAFQVMGVFILWFGWYGFNCGSTLTAVGQSSNAARVAATTTMSAACSGLTALMLAVGVEGKFSVTRMCNGILAGLVGITANCHVVEMWGAILIGMISAVCYFATSVLLTTMNVDDPLDAFAVHGATGVWGVMASALIGTEDLIREGGYLFGDDIQSFGTRFRNQFVGALSIAVWTTTFSGALFFGLKFFDVLRVDEATEKAGLNKKHEESAAWNFRSSLRKASDAGLNDPAFLKSMKDELHKSIELQESDGGEDYDEKTQQPRE